MPNLVGTPDGFEIEEGESKLQKKPFSKNLDSAMSTQTPSPRGSLSKEIPATPKPACCPISRLGNKHAYLRLLYGTVSANAVTKIFNLASNDAALLWFDAQGKII